ncbi:RagB/SusD family nutrient uptake outer membrane protein [Pedobacter sp. PWIIR3]
MKKTILMAMIISLLVISHSSCKKFVQVDPPASSLAGVAVYKSDAAASSAVNGIFLNIAGGDNFTAGITSITSLMGASADELKNYASDYTPIEQYYKNSVLVTSNSGTFWTELYSGIYQCNAAIEGIDGSSSVTTPLREQLIGEAKFMRAYFYFYLTNLYGEIPLTLTTDYKVNNSLSKSQVANVYAQIIKDLQEAKTLLPENFYTAVGGTSTERAYPVKAAASALLSRVYLYTKDWQNAETEANLVISNSKFSLTDPSLTFRKNSVESILQLAVPTPLSGNGNTKESQYFVLLEKPGQVYFPFALTQGIYDAFDLTDRRRSGWIGSYVDNSVTPNEIYHYPYKYKVNSDASQPNSEYLVMLRLAEQYLIRAEAKAHLGKLTEAANDLNKIRNRAGLSDFVSNDATTLLNAISQENRKEFFAEWGHRWFDLKRTGTIDQVMPLVAVAKGTTWASYKQLMPIPTIDIQRNGNLKQNAGY